MDFYTDDRLMWIRFADIRSFMFVLVVLHNRMYTFNDHLHTLGKLFYIYLLPPQIATARTATVTTASSLLVNKHAP